MLKQNIILLFISFVCFCLAGAVAGLLVHLLLTPVWYMAAAYTALLFIFLFLLGATFVSVNAILLKEDDV